MHTSTGWVTEGAMEGAMAAVMVTEAAEMEEDPHFRPLRIWTRTEICAFQKPSSFVKGHAALITALLREVTAAFRQRTSTHTSEG